MSKRKTKTTLASLSDCNRAMREIALIDIEVEKVQGECDEIVKATLAHAQRRAKSKIERRQQLVSDLAGYCDEHKPELTAEGKTIEMFYGRLGWRLSHPELALLRKKGFKATWKNAVALVKAALGEQFVRVKEEVKKDEIKAAGFDADKLAEAGLKIDQHDEWWYEIDRVKLMSAVQ